ncbi:MAG: GNAT family N-acetyltransferase [Deltaproteobacteria bacterium]|nr:GNAT family N-acetyltransferase [Deltaproteobacteria bacterium]
MGNRGRFGKYGEVKRLDRLRNAGYRAPPDAGRKIGTLDQPDSGRWEKKDKGEVKIRRAHHGDGPFILHLSSRVFHIYGPYADTILDWFNSPQTLTLIAESDGHAAGFAMLGPLNAEGREQGIAELLAIAVIPEKQRFGIGQKLIKNMEEKAKKAKIHQIFLYTATENQSAQTLFRGNGYTERLFRKNFYPAGQDAVQMEKEIGA